jgi:PAS domain S-box-containing protein
LLPRSIRWIRFCCSFLFFILLTSGLYFGLVHPQTQAQVLPAPAPKRVLLLYTYGDGLPAYQKATPAFLSVTTAGGININDLFFEYLDLQRNDNAEYRQRLADLLSYKYAEQQIGLIVTVHTGALNFLLDEAKELLPDAPVFSYLIVKPELIEAKNTGRRILQRPQNLDMTGTLEIALKMFPRTRKIVFVTGNAEGDRRLEHEAKNAFEPWRGKLEIQYTSDRSVEEILQLVASLPSRSIVIYNNVFSDKTGRTFIPQEVGSMVAKAANAPVFCLWDTLIGSGVIGGSLLSFEAEGNYAANVVLDILNRKIVLTKPVTTLPTSKTYMFDCQQLKRWGVNESILPKESVLVNRVPTLWEQHKGLVAVSIAAFLAQTVLVIGLLIQRNLKKKAELSVRQKTEELDQFFNVSLDLLCVANTDGYFLSLNPPWEKILGYTREELMAKRFLEFVHPDDVDRTRGAVSTLVSQQKVYTFENRYRSKDGTYRWLEWSSSPAGKLIYAAARDITERKQAEEALRKAHDRVRFFASQCLTAQETERKRIAGELHDSIAASLGAMKFELEKVTEDIKQGYGGPESLQNLASKVTEINNEVRRITADLRPSILDDLGIIAAMNWFCREYERTYSHISVEKQIAVSENEVPESLKTPIFRISQEAMNNIAKHSKASLVNLSLRKEDNKIVLAIQDNGRGFDLDTAGKGLGLTTMRERAQLSEGAFDLESIIGKGTTIRLSWPLI